MYLSIYSFSFADRPTVAKSEYIHEQTKKIQNRFAHRRRIRASPQKTMSSSRWQVLRPKQFLIRIISFRLPCNDFRDFHIITSRSTRCNTFTCAVIKKRSSVSWFFYFSVETLLWRRVNVGYTKNVFPNGSRKNRSTVGRGLNIWPNLRCKSLWTLCRRTRNGLRSLPAPRLRTCTCTPRSSTPARWPFAKPTVAGPLRKKNDR